MPFEKKKDPKKQQAAFLSHEARQRRHHDDVRPGSPTDSASSSDGFEVLLGAQTASLPGPHLEVENSIYAVLHRLGPSDRVPCWFTDPGRVHLASLLGGTEQSAMETREEILVGNPAKYDLPALSIELTRREKVSTIGARVLDLLGGELTDDRMSELIADQSVGMLTASGQKQISLDTFIKEKAGKCRHRALLFKVPPLTHTANLFMSYRTSHLCRAADTLRPVRD